jgi:hypothetical protein
MPTIYVTKFCPETKRVQEPSKPSGFQNLDDVVALMGTPLNRGVRTVTYRNLFYSEYDLHQTHGEKTFLNRSE